MDVCDLCGQRTTGGGFNRAAGLDICDRCLRGDLEIALRRIGAKIDTKLTIKEEESYGVGSETQYSLSLEGSIGFSRGMSASFGRATAFSRFRDKFGKKIRSGDPFFDEKIAVSSRSPEVLEALLRVRTSLSSKKSVTKYVAALRTKALSEVSATMPCVY